MLLHIRNKAQSWVAYAIIGLLIIGLSTVAWDAYFSPDPDVPVALVNGEKITTNQFQRAYAQQRARLQQMIGDADISQFFPDELELKQGVLKRLQEDELIFQAAIAAGYSVSDGLLAQQVRSLEVFQADGQFSPELYEQVLRQNYMSAGTFEDSLRRDILLQQYRMAIAATGWSTDQERSALLILQEQMRDVGFVTILAANYLDQVSVAEADAQAHYDENLVSFATEERVSIEYLELSIADLSKNVDIDEAKLQELYQDRQSDYGVPEERKTRHILIEVAGDATETESNAAREKANELAQQINHGAEFESIATQHSDDTGSAKEGGDLGFMSREMMIDPVFADAAFSLQQGEMSQPVKSAYGFHIIKLEAIKSGQFKTFEQVRAQLEQAFRRLQAEDSFYEQGEILANLSFENPDTLEVAAEELGLTLKTTPMFNRDMGVGIAMEAQVRSTAFSEEVLQQGLNSPPLELAGDRLIVLRIKDHEESTTRPFAEVKEAILQQLSQEAAATMAQETGEIIVQALAENPDLEALAKQDKLDWSHPAAFKRNDQSVSREIVEKAFRMQKPEAEQPSYTGLQLNSGDYAVIALFAVNEAAASIDDDAATESIKAQRERYYSANELLGAMTGMSQAAEIKEYPENF